MISEVEALRPMGDHEAWVTTVERGRPQAYLLRYSFTRLFRWAGEQSELELIRLFVTVGQGVVMLWRRFSFDCGDLREMRVQGNQDR